MLFRIVGVCLALLSVLPAPAAASAEWTQFRMNGANNAVVPEKLEASWQIETGGPISASPTYADGTLFIGNNAGTLFALNAATGRVKWKHHVANDLMSAPLVYRGLVIVGEGNAVSFAPSPAFPLSVGTGVSAILAFDERNGALRWRRPLRGSGMPTPAIINGVLVHHDGAGWISALDPMTGKLLYEKNLHSIASMAAALPVGDGDFVTAGVMGNSVWRIDARSGDVIWHTALLANASGIGDCPPVTDGVRLFCDYIEPLAPYTHTIVGHTVRQHAYTLNLRTGAREWDVPLEDGLLPPRNESGIPLAANDLFYIGSALAPWVNAVDPHSGHLQWRARTHGPVKGGFAAHKGVLYFGDFTGYLWAVDAKSGAPIGAKAMPSGFNVGSPIIVGRTLIAGSRTGTVYAVPLKAIRSSRDS